MPPATPAIGCSFVSLVETTAEAVQSAFDQLMENRPEALVVVVPHETVSRIAQDLASDVPTVVLEGDLSRTPLTAGVDNAQGARLATRHLLDLGHTSVVHLAGPPGWTEAAARTEGWRSELQDAGLDVPPLRWGGDWSARSGYRAGLALAREKDLTAVFAANDQMALGLMRRAARARTPGARRREHRRLRRPARGGVLRPAADDRASGLRGAGPAGDGARRAGARRRRSRPRSTWCPPRSWSAPPPPLPPAEPRFVCGLPAVFLAQRRRRMS